MSRFLGDEFLLPILGPHSEAWFTAGSIQVQCCDACGHAQHPPEDLCRRCQGSALSYRAMSGEGVVESAVVVHHPVHPQLVDHCPYAVALISIDGAPGCNAVGNVLGCAPEAVEIGARVRAVFEDASEPGTGRALKIPQWQLVGAD